MDPGGGPRGVGVEESLVSPAIVLCVVERRETENEVTLRCA